MRGYGLGTLCLQPIATHTTHLGLLQFECFCLKCIFLNPVCTKLNRFAPVLSKNCGGITPDPQNWGGLSDPSPWSASTIPVFQSFRGRCACSLQQGPVRPQRTEGSHHYLWPAMSSTIVQTQNSSIKIYQRSKNFFTHRRTYDVRPNGFSI